MTSEIDIEEGLADEDVAGEHAILVTLRMYYSRFLIRSISEITLTLKSYCGLLAFSNEVGVL